MEEIYLCKFVSNYPNMPEVKLKCIPEDTFAFILQTQADIKVEKKTSQYSIEKTIYRMLKEFQEMKKVKRGAIELAAK